MQEGESELGGLKIPHGNTTPPTSTPGPQPVGFETLQNTQNTPPATPTISATPATQSSPQSFIPNNTTEKETSSTNLASQTPTPQSTQPVQPLQPSARSPQSTSQAPFSPQLFPTQPSQPFIAQPTPAATSDILLSSTPTKKSKKWPTITIVSILVCAIIAGVIALIVFASKSAQNASAEALFNKFVNYLATGEEVETSPETISPDLTYTIDEYLESEDQDGKKEYFKNLDNIWAAFSSVYEKDVDNNEDMNTNENEDEDIDTNEDGDGDIYINTDEDIDEDEYVDDGTDTSADESDTDESSTSIIDEIGDNLYNITTYLEKGLIPQETILSKYLENGEDSVWNYYISYYDMNDEQNEQSDTILSFFNEQSFRIENIIEFIELSLANNCIQNSTLDSGCIAANGLDQTWPYLQILDSENSIESFAEEAVFRIKELIAEMQQDMEQQYEEE